MALSAYTYIDIVDVPLDNSYAHTLYFANETEQNAYFTARTVKQFSGYPYIRRTWSIKVEAHMSEARTWRYLRFINSFDNKMYYFFITSVDYINDETDTVAKSMIGLKVGDEIDFVCDYYNYDQEFQKNYYLGETMTIEGTPEISSTDVGEGGVMISYRFTDIYGQRYWTPPIYPD